MRRQYSSRPPFWPVVTTTTAAATTLAPTTTAAVGHEWELHIDGHYLGIGLSDADTRAVYTDLFADAGGT